MKDTFMQIPGPLRRQIVYRLGIGIAVLLASAAFLMADMDLFSVLSCITIVLFCFFSALSLLCKAARGDYVVISGECQGVALTAVKKRTKMMILHTDDCQVLRVMIKQRLKKIRAGSRITLYVAANMPVYEKEDALLLHSYLAIETNGGE